MTTISNKIIKALWQDLLEKDDRTSPSEYPDMALITFEEFNAAVLAATAPEIAAVELRERPPTGATTKRRNHE